MFEYEEVDEVLDGLRFVSGKSRLSIATVINAEAILGGKDQFSPMLYSMGLNGRSYVIHNQQLMLSSVTQAWMLVVVYMLVPQ